MTKTDDLDRIRLAICVGTIAATIPYLALKIAWISGSTIGVHGGHGPMNGSAMHSGTMITANALTLGMDTVAAGLALAMIRPWGRRIPGWLLVFPMWVATGFLAPIVAALPFAAVAGALTGGISTSGKPGQDLLAGWVYAMVYGGFGVQALGLLAGLVLHARTRWGSVFTLRLSALPSGPANQAGRVIVTGVGAFGMIPVLIHLYWAAGGTGWAPGDDRPAAVQLVLESGFGLLTVVGIGGVLALTWRRDSAPARWALIAAWAGTAATFSWGLLWMLLSSVTTPLTGGQDMRGLAAVGGMQVLVGAVLATVLALMVVEAAADGGESESKLGTGTNAGDPALATIRARGWEASVDEVPTSSQPNPSVLEVG